MAINWYSSAVTLGEQRDSLDVDPGVVSAEALRTGHVELHLDDWLARGRDGLRGSGDRGDLGRQDLTLQEVRPVSSRRTTPSRTRSVTETSHGRRSPERQAEQGPRPSRE